MGKLAYFFTTFVGAIPAGFGIYVMVRHFLDRAEAINGILLTVSIMITVCLFLIALTPFIVLIFYKDSSPQLAVAGAGAAGAAAGGSSGGSDPETEDEGFGDAIPTDFDQDELEASIPDSEFDDFEDEGEYAEDDDGYDESEFEDFDLDEVE